MRVTNCVNFFFYSFFISDIYLALHDHWEDINVELTSMLEVNSTSG